MQTGREQAQLSSGRPLEDPAFDKLGYGHFAQTLADGIQKMAPLDGLVIAVYGAWGSGKTTMLNFVEHYVLKAPEDERPIIFRFNPWWFSGPEELTLHFFTELRLVLGKRSGLGKLLTNLADLAEIVSETTPYAPLGKLGALGLRKAARQKRDVVELKDEIAKALKEQNHRILIVIDDIDRLTMDEIRQVFRVIKAVANFPNVVYLLAFDKKVIVEALREMQGLPGEDYLEKIVQVPFELPFPTANALKILLFDELNVILADTPNGMFDATYWGNVFVDGVRHFITTPRDVIRLTNTLHVTYPAVRGEVNPVDFIAIETLRVFCALAYDFVRKNSFMFTGHTGPMDRPQDLKPLHEEWMKGIKEKEDMNAVKSLLMRLFPKFQSAWENIHYDAGYESIWRRDRRICSLDVFPTFFRLTVPEGDISNHEMKATLSLVSDANTFAAKLLEFVEQKRPDGTTKARSFLDRFMDYYEQIPVDAIPSVIQALLEVGDNLLVPEDESRGFLEDSNEIRILRIILHLLPRLAEEVRFKILSDAMARGLALSTIVHTASSLARQHGKYGAQPQPPDQRLLTIEHAEQLERIAVERIRSAATQDVLARIPDFVSVLYRWREWANEEEVKQWVQRSVATDEGLANFVNNCLGKVLSYTITDRVTRVSYRLDPSLRDFIGSDEITRIERLVQEERWSDEKKSGVEQFLHERNPSISPQER